MHRYPQIKTTAPRRARKEVHAKNAKESTRQKVNVSVKEAERREQSAWRESSVVTGQLSIVPASATLWMMADRFRYELFILGQNSGQYRVMERGLRVDLMTEQMSNGPGVLQ